MSSEQTELAIPEITQQALAAFSEPQQALAACRSYKELTVEKDGITKVTASRVAVKKLRVSIDKRRKEQNQAALDHQRAVNSFAQKLIADVSEIEDYLGSQEDAYEAEKRAKLESIEAEKTRKLMDRVRRLEAAGVDSSDVESIRTMTDFQFGVHFETESRAAAERREKDAADQRIAEQRQRELQEERDRIALEQAEENRRQAEELRIREAELAAERMRMEDEQAEMRRQQQEIRQRQDVERFAKEQRERNAREAAELAAKLARLEALKPEIEKAETFLNELETWSDNYLTEVRAPWAEMAQDLLLRACVQIRTNVERGEWS